MTWNSIIFKPTTKAYISTICRKSRRKKYLGTKLINYAFSNTKFLQTMYRGQEYTYKRLQKLFEFLKSISIISLFKIIHDLKKKSRETRKHVILNNNESITSYCELNLYQSVITLSTNEEVSLPINCLISYHIGIPENNKMYTKVNNIAKAKHLDMGNTK